MKFVSPIVFASIEAKRGPKIQIYEIRDKGNGMELIDLESTPSRQQTVESRLLSLLLPKNKEVSQQLIENLKTLKGEEGYQLTEDAYIYILHDLLNRDTSDSSSSADALLDKKRQESVQAHKPITYILEQLLREKEKQPKVNLLPFRSHRSGVAAFGIGDTSPPMFTRVYAAGGK